MDMVAHLEKILNQYQYNPPVEDLRMQGWRFAVNDHTVIKAGIRNNKLGEVYAAPTLNQGCSGDLLIIWPGDFCSHVEVNPAVVNDLERRLPFWRQGAYQDPEGSVLLGSEPLPLAAVEHQSVKAYVREDPKPLFQLLNRFREELPAWGISSIQAGVQAGWGLRHVRTSQGLAVSYAQTSFNVYVLADGLYGKSFSKRRPAADVEVQELLTGTGTTVQKLKNETSLESGKMSVVLSPELVEEFVAKYLLSNLSGNAVINNQGAYTLEDFGQGKQTFDPRVTIAVNPLKPFELSSYLCTREGLPARSQRLIHKGKLVTPYLTVKDSIKAGLAPTPLPQGSGLWLEVEGAQEIDEMVQGIDHGILVCSVLGLHTQDATGGSYSLSAPQCLKIEAGRITGRVKTVISGNFLQHLADSATGYAFAAGENFPAMRFDTSVVQA